MGTKLNAIRYWATVQIQWILIAFNVNCDDWSAMLIKNP